MVSLGMNAAQYYEKQCLQKQQRDRQFSENIKDVMFGGYGTGSRSLPRSQSETRTRSPGLAAGAALALSHNHPAAEARSAAQQNKDRERTASCPFDDHTAFIKRESALNTNALPAFFATDAVEEQKEAYENSKTMRKQFRDLQQKIGANAPFDTPETSAAPAFSIGQQAAMAGQAKPQEHFQALAEACMDAKRHKAVMAGTKDLIAGHYVLGETKAERGSRRPPVPERVLPQAQIKAKFDGVQLSDNSVAYLNARVASEANRERNQCKLMLG